MHNANLFALCGNGPGRLFDFAGFFCGTPFALLSVGGAMHILIIDESPLFSAALTAYVQVVMPGSRISVVDHGALPFIDTDNVIDVAIVHPALRAHLNGLNVKRILDPLSGFSGRAIWCEDFMPVMTAKERDLVPFILRGAPDKEIAMSLDMTLASVKFYMRGLYAKLGVANRTQAALMLRRISDHKIH